uniref:Uncharacterized protein n=1 Tax=Timspurckia oligopyrenoides TaxID=708627 RepID=A0A7S1EPK5_9RHOD
MNGAEKKLLDDRTIIKEERRQVETEIEHMNGAKMWESGEKKKALDLLAHYKEQIRLRQEEMAHSVLHVQELSQEIAVLQSKLKLLNERKFLAQRKILEPSLEDLLDTKSRSWDPLSRSVYNKTKELVHDYESVASSSDRSSRFVVALVFLLMYTLLVGCMYLAYFMFVRARLSVSKLILLGDICFASFWILVTVLNLILSRDPLYVFSTRISHPFIFFQLTWLCSFVGYTILRVIHLAVSMSLSVLAEVVCVIVVGHHYYIHIWRPAMMDEEFGEYFVFYLCYCCLFIGFSVNKLQALLPLQSMGRSKLSLGDYLRIVLKRLTEPEAPRDEFAASLKVEDADTFDLFANIRKE